MADSLNIVHCLRAPLGGLFRHVSDLARAQAAMDHRIGIVCAAGGDGTVDQALNELSPACVLGIERISISRMPGLGDFAALGRIAGLARAWDAQILHGHGAKGGAYARLAAAGSRRMRRFYTPHGGSLHYSPRSPGGLAFLTAERLLMKRTSGIIFESEYSASIFSAKVGPPSCPVRVIHNGLSADEFAAATQEANAADFLFIGELRDLKGVHILLEALAMLCSEGRDLRLVCVGDGPDAARFRTRAAELGLDQRVSFPGRLSARTAFARGRILVIPSLAESFPYIVLEGAAARMPMIATNVGGIGEIFGEHARRLVPPGDAAALARAMAAMLDGPETAAAAARDLQQRAKRNFNVERMARAVTDFYEAAV